MTTARELTDRLAALLRNERNAMADFLLALADFDREKRWRELGHSGLFYFLHRELGLSKGAAHYRKTAAELVQQFPEIVEPLRDGRLCMTSIVELARVITPGNRAEVLPRFFNCSKRDAQELAAEIRPQEAPPRRQVITTVRPEPAREELLPANAPAVTHVPGLDHSPSVLVQLANLSDANSKTTPQKSSPKVEPLTADLRRLHLTVSRRFLEKLSAARDALSHSKPSASTEEILEAGLDLILAADAKKKGLVAKPLAKPRPSKQGRYIPAHVRREVWKRDQGRCQFRFESGEICGSTFRLEVDHLDPVALGGVATVERCRLACEAHNKLAARRVFGDEFMDGFARKGAKPSGVREPVARYGCGSRSSGSGSSGVRASLHVANPGRPCRRYPSFSPSSG